MFLNKKSFSKDRAITNGDITLTRSNNLKNKIFRLYIFMPFEARKTTNYPKELEYAINKCIRLRKLTVGEYRGIESKINLFHAELERIENAILNDEDKAELRNKLAYKVVEYFELAIDNLLNKTKNIENFSEKEAISKRIDKL